MEEEKKELAAPEYITAYTIDDELFAEPFIILKPVATGRPSWWENRIKVENLIAAFKMDLTIEEACVKARISVAQYKYFCEIHPHFSAVKSRLKSFVPIVAKTGLLSDLNDPDGSRARQWYLERRQPHLYGRDIGAFTPPPAAAAQKITAEAYLDGEGKVLVSRQTAEILTKEYGNEDGENKPEQDKPSI